MFTTALHPSLSCLPLDPSFLVSATHVAGVVANIPGHSVSYRPSGAVLVTYPVGPHIKHTLAVSWLSRHLASVGIRHRVVRYGAGRFGSPRSFRGFAVVIARGQV